MIDSISIEKIGSFTVGGKRVTLSGLPCYEAQTNANASKRLVDPNGDFWTGQLYAQYIKLAKPQVQYPLLLWHGGGLTGSCWETTPDGREGWQMFFLRHGYVYVSDAVERGRASWSRYPEIYTDKPMFRTYKQAWESFRIGPHYASDLTKCQPYPGSQYPLEAFELAMQQAVPRWTCNNEAIQAAYDAYLAKVGPAIIISHSQNGAFAANAARHNPSCVKAIVFVEPAGLPTLDATNLAAIQDIPQLFVWGDNLDKYPTWAKNISGKDSFYKSARRYYDALYLKNKQAKWVELPQIGIQGNCHMMMQDRNSDIIAEFIHTWLKQYW